MLSEDAGIDDKLDVPHRTGWTLATGIQAQDLCTELGHGTSERLLDTVRLERPIVSAG
jgi:hypothetical protein